MNQDVSVIKIFSQLKFKNMEKNKTKQLKYKYEYPYSTYYALLTSTATKVNPKHVYLPHYYRKYASGIPYYFYPQRYNRILNSVN